MRLAVISDIHGNTLALQTVLDDIAGAKVDSIVCLGDLAAMGFDPAGAIERIAELDIPVVRGNTDDILLNEVPNQTGDQPDVDMRRDLVEWVIGELTSEHRAFLESLVPVAELDLGDVTVCCYHGSPQSYNDPILPDTPDEQLDAWFAGIDAPILIGGHTHRQMLRRWNGRIITNPGPVSLTFERLPVQRGSTRPWTEYAILSADEGAIRVDFRYLPLDLDALATATRRSGMPHADVWLAGWGIEAS